jgi:broad specificity phosphatase PhoE
MKLQKTIYMTRHGATPYNDKDLLQGLIDISLSEKGLGQSRQLAERLKSETIDAIYHSPLNRAKETADEVNRYHNAPMESVDGFVEMDMGEWEGRNFFQVIEEHPDVYQQWIYDPDGGMPGGESFNQVYRRVKDGTDALMTSPYKNILVVTHAMVSRAILGNLLKLPPMGTRRFRTGNCCLSKLSIYEGPLGPHIVVDYWNNTSHISPT